jgi:hypothetical protein
MARGGVMSQNSMVALAMPCAGKASSSNHKSIVLNRWDMNSKVLRREMDLFYDVSFRDTA